MDTCISQAKCEAHKECYSKIYIGKEGQKRLMCDACESQAPCLTLSKAEILFPEFQSYVKFQSYQKEEFIDQLSSQIMKLKIVFTSLIGLFSNLNEQIQEQLKKEIQPETMSLTTKNFKSLTVEEIAHYSSLIMDYQTKPHDTPRQSPLHDLLKASFKNSLDEYRKLSNEMSTLIEKLSNDFANLDQQIQIQKREFQEAKSLMEPIDYMEFAHNIQKLVVVQKNQLIIFQKRKNQFLQEQIIKSEHQRITALCLDSENRVYTAGDDGKIQTFTFKKYQFYNERLFLTNSGSEFFKIIFDEKKKQLITSTKTNVEIWEDQQRKQSLSDDFPRHAFYQITCIAINNDFLIFNDETQILIWQRWYNEWKFMQEIKCQEVIDICFLSPVHFLSIDKYSQIFQWKLDESYFLSKDGFSAQAGSLFFIQKYNLLLCHNKGVCEYFEYRNDKFYRISKQLGENMKICLTNNGEQIIKYNFGKLIIKQKQNLLLVQLSTYLDE